MTEAIYSRATQALFERTYGKLEHDEIKVLQLFDRLLTAGYSIHVDDLRRLCRDAGYDPGAADDIGQIYDTLRLIRYDLRDVNTPNYWPSEAMQLITAPDTKQD